MTKYTKVNKNKIADPTSASVQPPTATLDHATARSDHIPIVPDLTLTQPYIIPSTSDQAPLSLAITPEFFLLLRLTHFLLSCCILNKNAQ